MSECVREDVNVCVRACVRACVCVCVCYNIGLDLLVVIWPVAFWLSTS